MFAVRYPGPSLCAIDGGTLASVWDMVTKGSQGIHTGSLHLDEKGTFKKASRTSSGVSTVSSDQ